jgi:DNA (cytosine-5)-methyltransferase 1
MESLGYVATILSHNSMHHGVPQSRDRIFVVWLRSGIKADLDLELSAHCARCDCERTIRQAFKPGRRVGRYRQQWVWVCTTCTSPCEPSTEPAAKIIDWALPCPRIGDRTRPLAPATRDRIAAGLARYGWLQPITTTGAGNVHERTPGNRARSLAEPLPTQQTTATSALATPPGFLFQTAHGGRTTALADPHPTVCASDDRHALVVPLRRNGHAAPTSDPAPTVTAGGNHHALLMRNNTGGEEMCTPITEPARTMTTAGHQSLLVPHNRTGRARDVEQPSPTLTTRDRVALLDPDTVLDECGFRMLEPYEVAAAMAFPVGYIPRALPKKDQVKLAGNAVTPPVMTWILSRVIQALEAR